MSDESNEFEGFRVADSSEPVDEFAAPGRSVFGDDDISFEETTTPSRTGASRQPGRCPRSVAMRR